MTNPSGISKTRLLAGNLLVFLPGAVLAGSAVAKFAQIPKVVLQMAALGFCGPRLMLIGGLELTSAALYLASRTRPIGFLLASAYLGGAIAAHVGHGEPPTQPGIFLALLWIGAWLRHPEVLWYLSRGKTSSAAAYRSQ